MSVSNEAPAISVTGLSYRYSRNGPPALSDITFSAPRGSSFGLIGPNGAGKSTLLSLLTGVLKPQEGEIEIAGFSARDNLEAIRAVSALVPQDLAFYPALTGQENLEYFAGIFRLTPQQWRERRERAVEVSQLADVLNKPSESYSGGLKRRLNLAIGLLNAPQILYLDEPTVGIDARSRQTIVDAIRRLNGEGTTIIYTSHYMEEVEAICDRVGIINQGKLVALESTEKLLQQAAKKVLHVTLATPANDQLRIVLAQQGALFVDDERLTINLTDIAKLPETIGAVQAAGAPVASVEYGVGRLEEVYLGILDKGSAA
ncbi:MAG: ABC transporter ATP-binding protein [Caulobacterales bacterium]